MYLALDCETTGLDHKVNNLLTAYFMILDSDLNVIDTFDLKLKHNVYNITVKALEINKIDIIKHDTESIPVVDAKIKFKKFLLKNKGPYRYTSIAHNGSFDKNFLLASGILTEQEYSEYISVCTIDTMIVANFLKLTGDIPSNKALNLTSLCKYYNINNENAHNCEADIKMTIELLKCMRESKKQGEEHTRLSLCTKKRKFHLM
jgi:DNA polymerase III alpha subunit (gram-positive type)